MSKELIKREEGWYEKLLGDLKKLEFTGIVLTKLAYGNRILKDFEKFGKPEYGKKTIGNIAKDLEVGKTEVYDCIKFAEKVRENPKFSDTVGKLQLSWRNIVHDYLYDKKEIKLLEIPQLPEGVFNVVLADPPWAYNFSETESRSIENKYPTMKLEEIKNYCFPVAENAVLFLWATAPKIQEALEVMISWGFEYKTQAIWNKVIMGMGYWFRGQHEILMVGTKGNFSPPEEAVRYNSIINEKRTEHSRKPQIVYEMLQKMFPKGKALELFNRGGPYNEYWKVMGNQSMI